MIPEEYSDIAASPEWEEIRPVDKGWSKDKKYLIHTKSGEKLLLRTADREGYEEKRREYEMIEKYSRLGFPMSMPRDFGLCSQGERVYMLLSWVEGEDLEQALPKLEERQQYRLGRQAGEILKRIHGLKVEAKDIPSETKVEKKLEQLKRYEESNVRIPGDEIAIQYVKDRIHRIWSKAPAYLHGDFHPGNLIYQEDGNIGVIDFNRWEVGDPYEEFYKLQSFGRNVSVPYCTGELDAYFDGEVPEGFWEIQAVYVAQASLFSIKWAEKFGQRDVDKMTEICRTAFRDYDGFRRLIPIWYDSRMKEAWGQ